MGDLVSKMQAAGGDERMDADPWRHRRLVISITRLRRRRRLSVAVLLSVEHIKQHSREYCSYKNELKRGAGVRGKEERRPPPSRVLMPMSQIASIKKRFVLRGCGLIEGYIKGGLGKMRW